MLMEQTTKELVGIDEIAEYLPQKAPMIMIDRIYQCGEKGVTTGLTLRSDNIFVKEGVFTEPGIVENIAQAAAAKGGYEIKKRGAETMIGFIGALKDLKIYFHPPIGSELITEIAVKNEVFSVTLIEGRSTCNGRVVAECEMKIVIAKPDHKFSQ
jgi:predicted hotdog family 3-hydroxylacyl-ACP dehydratase